MNNARTGVTARSADRLEPCTPMGGCQASAHVRKENYSLWSSFTHDLTTHCPLQCVRFVYLTNTGKELTRGLFLFIRHVSGSKREGSFSSHKCKLPQSASGSFEYKWQWPAKEVFVHFSLPTIHSVSKTNLDSLNERETGLHGGIIIGKLFAVHEITYQ